MSSATGTPVPVGIDPGPIERWFGVHVPEARPPLRYERVNGAPFYVMSHVDGVVPHTASDAERMFPSRAARRRAAGTMVDALVALHGVDIDAVGLGDFARRSGYLDRQLKRWSAQWEASKTRELPAMEQLHTWLVQHRPAESEVCIVHGDFRLGNALHAPDGTTLAVLDWELSTLGDPLADVSYLLRSWVPADEVTGDEGLPSSVEGFPGRDELAERYASASGRTLDELDYWMALNSWRSAAIAEGVYRRYIDGKMGDAPPDVERHARSVEITVRQGLISAGLAR